MAVRPCPTICNRHATHAFPESRPIQETPSSVSAWRTSRTDQHPASTRRRHDKGAHQNDRKDRCGPRSTVAFTKPPEVSRHLVRTYTNNNRHPPGDRARVDGVQHDEVDATVRFPVRPDTFIINTKSTQAGSSREKEEEGVLLPVATPAREVDRQCECYEDVHECGSTQSPADRHLEQVKASQTGDGMGRRAERTKDELCARNSSQLGYR